MHDDLRIRVSTKSMPAAFQIGTQFPEIVDLPVENDPHLLVRIGHGLMTSRQINDGKPSESQTYGTGHKIALIVRAAMGYRSSRSFDRFQLDPFLSNEVILTADSAHASCSFLVKP